MINTVIFDLDGVLAVSKELHFEALNLALQKVDEKYVISKEDHLKHFDGLSTNVKLRLLSKERNLPIEKYESIWEDKQNLTIDLIKKYIKPEQHLIDLFKKLQDDAYMIIVASNSIRETTHLFLQQLGLKKYVRQILTNEDCGFWSKPHPFIYLKAMVDNHIRPKEALIIEDSHVGITSALESGGNIMVVKNPSEVTIESIYNKINELDKTETKIIYKGKKMNILIPMAGAGSRFQQAGYTFPKPLIDVHGKPMIQVVVENLAIEATYTYVVRKEHYEKYNLKYMLNIITPNCNIVVVDSLTEGAACTTLLAKEFINNDEPLLIANSDQFIEWNTSEFMYAMNGGVCDGGILTFYNVSPKWSYVKLDEDKYVTELTEKKVISDKATVGIYYYAKGSDYVKYAEQMINKNIRVNGEFYVAPVYNEFIADGKKIKIFDIEKMWGLGTPEDLNYFLQNYKGKI